MGQVSRGWAGVVLSASALVVCGSSAQELIYAPGETLGVRAVDKSRNEWRGEKIAPTRRANPDDYKSIGKLDFFTLEYGELLTPFDVVTGERGDWERLWGSAGGDDTTHPGIRFGRMWGGYSACRFRLEIALEQNQDTEWELQRLTRSGAQTARFSLKGVGERREKVDLGLIGDLSQVKGLRLVCRSPGTRAKVREFRILPYALPMEWRHTFVLDEEPHFAGVSFWYLPMCSLRINGKSVYEGARILSMNGVIRRDITRELRKGQNEIVFRGDFNGGYGPQQKLLLEAFCVAQDGTTTVLSDGERWQWRFVGGEWQQARRDDPINIDRLANGKEIAGNLVALHVGALQIRPCEPDGSGYPVFDIDRPIIWEARLPPGLPNARLDAQVVDAMSGSPAGRLTAQERRENCWTANLSVDRPGAFYVRWKLMSGDRTVDSLQSEMVVAGPVEQDAVDLDRFEAVLASRLELVQEIDCATAPTDATNFLDHASRGELNVGRLSETCGAQVRETGPSKGDFFAYPIRVGRMGQAHIAEVEFPDDVERIMRVAVLESLPVPFCNNTPPEGSAAHANASGEVKTGGLMPLSGRMKKMTVVFFPGARNITISLVNDLQGSRAAVSKIRVYEVRGGLPALSLPKTERLYANHCERPLCAPWGGFVNPATAVTDRDLCHDMWIAAFHAAANRIRYLRFAGHNAAIEGVHMYVDRFPSVRGESRNFFIDFDYAYCLAKMYGHNGIKMLAGVEFMKSPKFDLENRNAVSDREIQRGTARGIYNVDRYGRQTIGYMGMGYNTFSPKVWASVTNLVDEIAERYGRLRGIVGLWTINGGWWLPGFTTPPGVNADEVGYDDDTIESFERDTGISLRSCGRTGVGRFEERHRRLNGELREKWRNWRSRKLRAQLEEIGRIVRVRAPRWDYLPSGEVYYPADTPFRRLQADQSERDAYSSDWFARSGYPPELYGKGSGSKVSFIPSIPYTQDLSLEFYGIAFSKSLREIVRRNDAAYFHATALNERWENAAGAKTWWWRNNTVCVYDCKQCSPYACFDLVELCRHYTPRYVFHSWLDVNLTTAHTEDERRFLVGFYATPADRNPKPIPWKGVTATRYGGKIQLLNATPYALRGAAGDLPPFGIRVVDGDGGSRPAFRFDAETNERIRNLAHDVLTDDAQKRKIPPELKGRLGKLLNAGDVYGMAVVFREFEMMRRWYER